MSDKKEVITPSMIRGGHPDMPPMEDNYYLAVESSGPSTFKAIQQALYEGEIPVADWPVIGNLAFRIGYLHVIGYDEFRFGDDAEVKTALDIYKRFAPLMPGKME
jgi:hypothetical protein